jgi:hypothetical protein
MLHLLYIFVFTIIAFLAISNLIRSLITISTDVGRNYSPQRRSYGQTTGTSSSPRNLHPELLDEAGRPLDEPLLVMRSVTVDDARQKLDDLYNSSPGNTLEVDEDK